VGDSGDGAAAPAPTARRPLTWCDELGVKPDHELRSQLIDGFGPSGAGEDLFDAVVGLFGMIDTVRRYPEPPIQEEPPVRELEGWMFGQQPSPDPLDAYGGKRLPPDSGSRHPAEP
jgi:hypothetical protein